MNLHERQQFEFFLLTAGERFMERIQQRCGSAEAAAERLQNAPEGEGVWLSQFVDALFRDFLLDNPEGACWVLCALEKQRLPADLPPQPTINATLGALARYAYASLLRRKCLEAFDQAANAVGRA